MRLWPAAWFLISASSIALSACHDTLGTGRRTTPRAVGALSGDWGVSVSNLGPYNCRITELAIHLAVVDTFVTATFTPAATSEAEKAALQRRYERDRSTPGISDCTLSGDAFPPSVMDVPKDMPAKLSGRVRGDSIWLSQTWRTDPNINILSRVEFLLHRSGPILTGEARFSFAADGQPISSGSVYARRR
jgi:hypothetical protein